MNLPGKSLIVAMAVALPVLGGAFPAAAAERKPDLKVIYDPPRLSVDAQGVSSRRVLEEIGAKVGFSVVGYGTSDRSLTVSIQGASLDEVLNEILRGENYAFVYEGAVPRIQRLILLSSPAALPAMAANQQQRETRPQGTVPVQAGLTHHPSVSQPALLGERKRGEKAEAQVEVKIEDIMRVHALSGLLEQAGALSGPANTAQFSRSPAESSFSARRTANPPPQDIRETLAVTTRLAQQNLKALVDGLATASNSLFQSLPSEGR